MNSKLALVFMVVLVAVLKSSDGKHINDIKDIKTPLVAAKVGVGKSIAAKIKFVAFKKWAAAKTIAKAPFVLGKKLALFKIGAIRSLTALKLAKAKKVLNIASEKTAPAVAAVASIPAAVASIPGAIAGIPAKAVAALKPTPHAQISHQQHVVDIYTIPVNQQHYQTSHSSPSSGHYSGNYKSAVGGSRTFENDYSLVPGTGANNNYVYYPEASSADSLLIKPHSTYGVPN